MADLGKLVDDLSSLTVIEAAELAKMLEEKWGVSAAAPVAVAAGGGGGAAGGGCGGRRRRGRGGASAGREDRVRRHSRRDRREEGQRDQGSPRDHRARPQGG